MDNDGLLKRISSRSPWSRRRRSLNIASSTSDVPNRCRTPSESPLPLARFHRFAASLRLPPNVHHSPIPSPWTRSDRWSRHNSLPQGIRYNASTDQGRHQFTSYDHKVEYGGRYDSNRVARRVSVYSETSNDESSTCGESSVISGNLGLPNQTDKPEKLRSLSKRRSRDRAQRNLSGASNEDESPEMSRSRVRKTSPTSDSSDRKNVKEGRVILATGLQRQVRYLFLFNDTLLIAKEVKETYRGVSSHTYKLKDKIRVCELWVRGGGVEEVAECVSNPEYTFIIGWPTVNYVAIFQTADERREWYELLRSQTSIQKALESPKVTSVNVHFKRGNKNEVRQVRLNNEQTARELLRLALFEFEQEDDYTHDLWVHSDKETAPYPLYGHEFPFAIFMSHLRDNLNQDLKKSGIPSHKLENLAKHEKEFGIRCRFILRPRAGNSQTLGSPRQLANKPSRTSWMDRVKKRVLSRSESVDVPDSTPEPTGVLFGHPLGLIQQNNNKVDSGIPAPVRMMLEHLFKEGVFVEGVFRKPPKQSSVKTLKSRLDKGEHVNISTEYYPLVTASVLKDFLRNIPNKLLISDYYYDWVAAYNEKDGIEKGRSIRTVLARLPPYNYQLLKHLLCVLYHVSVHCNINHMNSNSLSVCIGPSLLDPGRNCNNSHSSAKQIPRIVQMLIDDFENLFGEESLFLFGEPPQAPPSDTLSKQESSEESDSIGRKEEAEAGSSDSISTGGSRPPSSMKQPVTSSISRDSGLSDVHLLHEENPKMGSNSVDNLVEVHIFDDADEIKAGKKYSTLERSLDVLPDPDSPSMKNMNRSWHSTSQPITNDIDDVIDMTHVSSNPSSSSRKPLRLTKQISDTRTNYTASTEETTPKRSTLRSHKHLFDATLHRSESGEHLLLSTEVPADRMEYVLQTRKERSQNSKDKQDQTDSGRESSGGGGSPDSQSRLLGSSKVIESEYKSQAPIASSSRFPPLKKTVAEIYPLHMPCVAHTHSDASSSGASSLSSLNSDSENIPHVSTQEAQQLLKHVKKSVLKVVSNTPSTRYNSNARRRFDGADSSTVTEDEDDDLTPVVSRENSSAKELENKAKGMFSPKNKIGETAMYMTSCDVVQGPFVATSRPAWDRRPSTGNTQAGKGTTITPAPLMRSKPVNAVPSIIRTTPKQSKLETSPEACQPSTSSPVPPTYEESMRQRFPNLWVPSGVQVPVEPGQVKERIKRYDRERLRRKTLAGDEFKTLADLSKVLTNNNSNNNRLSMGAPVMNNARAGSYEKLNEMRDKHDAEAAVHSWSVKRIKSMFDEAVIPSCSESNRPPPKPWARCANSVYKSAGPPNEPPPRPPVSTMFCASKFSSSSSVETCSGRISVSDAQSTYPVVRPPPLTPSIGHTDENTNFPLRLQPLSAKTIQSAGLVKALASNFEHGVVSHPGSKKGEESYV